MNESIGACLEKWAEVDPDKIAVAKGDRRTTYLELNAGVLEVSRMLEEEGIKVGDKVAVLCENSPEFVMAYFGAQRAGGVTVPLNAQCTPHELMRILDHSESRFIFVEKKFMNGISRELRRRPSRVTVFSIEERTGFAKFSDRDESAAAVSPGENGRTSKATQPAGLATIMYTSGTTGKPKGVMLTGRNIYTNASSIVQYLGLSADDKGMVILPFYYSYGMSLLTTHIQVGGTLVLENSFMYPAKVLSRMEEEEVTGFAGVPTTFSVLLNKTDLRKYRFPRMRYLTQAGGAMSPKHAQALQSRLTDVSVFIMYGQTEATARLAYLEPVDLHRKAGSIGKAIPGVTIEVIKEDGTPAAVGEEGEIVASGPNIMAGYWKDSEETRKVLRKGRLFTGDRARLDEEGYLYIIGRRSDMIKSGANRISPKEIEEAILEVSQVHEVAVIGVPDDILGEVILAVIVLKDGQNCTAREVQKHCRSCLAPFKRPRNVIFAETLQKTSSGKIQKFRLKELYGQECPDH